MEKLQPVQLRNMDLVVSSFALTKIVICIRKLLLLFVTMVVYIPSVLRIRNWLNYGWLKTASVQNCMRRFFVCTKRENRCKFWQWGDICECPRSFCQHDLLWCERKVKKDGSNQNRLGFFLLIRRQQKFYSLS